MKLSFISILVSLSFIGIAQSITPMNEYHIQNGSFVCRLNDHIIYSATDDVGEYVTYKLYSFNMVNHKKIAVDSMLRLSCWAKTSDTTLLCANSNKLYIWNSCTNAKKSILPSFMFNDIIAIGFNQQYKKLVVFEFNHLRTILTLKVFDWINHKVFDQKIKINEMELEGIYPRVESFRKSFVFMVQNDLYALNLANQTPVLKLLSDKCDAFALVDEAKVLYYKFISAEKTTGYQANIDNSTVEKIDMNLDEKIFHCSNLNLFSARMNDKIFPVYRICAHSYLFSDRKWRMDEDHVLYKDEHLSVRYLLSKDSIAQKNCFQWINLQ